MRPLARVIDTEHMGLPGVIGAWEHDGLIVDPGPATTIPALLEGLGEDFEPRAILLTHIHLDHAGGTGTLLERFPGTPVYVHAIGAPHVIDPSRLWKSAARLYGEDRMAELWGDVRPVPAEVVITLEGGERVEGFEVMHAPGHAAHHVVYLERRRRGLRRRRRRRSHAARDLDRDADAAAGDRRRCLAGHDRSARRASAATGADDALR